MTEQEFTNWAQESLARKGLWTIDPVHDGVRRKSFLAHRSRPDDQYAGIYVQVSEDGRLLSGRYSDACPHIGEAMFQIKVDRKFEDFDKAVKYAIESLGMQFLIEACAM